MCRIVVVCGAEARLLEEIVSARLFKRGQIFEVRPTEKLHGFGIAWRHAQPGAVGALVTLDQPLSALNVRRVCRATASRVVLAHMRCCNCTTCPAMTYCPAREMNCQPLLHGRLSFAHVGIVADHHALLAASPRVAAVDRALSTPLDDAGETDSAFVFALLVSFYEDPALADDPNFQTLGKLACAVARTLRELSRVCKTPSALNVVASDGDDVVLTRYRTPGDDVAAPPLWCAQTETDAAFASSPVALVSEEHDWREVKAGTLVRVRAAAAVDVAWHALGPLLAESAPSDAPAEAAAPGRRARSKPKVDVSAALRLLDAALRDVVRSILGAARGSTSKAVGAHVSREKKAVHADLRAKIASGEISDDDGVAQAIADAVQTLRRRCEAASSPAFERTESELAYCGSGLDGGLARILVAELDQTEGFSKADNVRGSLALLQARLYDSRYDDGAVGEAATADKAGVEEVKDVMQSEARAFRDTLRLALANKAGAPDAATDGSVTVLDFGAGDGRFLAEFVRAQAAVLADDWKTLRVIAYDVSRGALRAFRRRCTRDFGFAVVTQTAAQARHAAVALRVGKRAAVEILFVEGDALAPPDAVEKLFAGLGNMDVVLSGWGSTSAIPHLALPGASADSVLNDRQDAFVRMFCTLAPVLVQVVSSANNFMGEQASFNAMRAERRRKDTSSVRCAELDATLRLADRDGGFYYTVGGHDYFYSAVAPDEETERLIGAGYHTAEIRPCNVVSFRDILANSALAKLEHAALKLVEANDHAGYQFLLSKCVARKTRTPLSKLRTAPLFDANRTLVTQASRYIISVATRLAGR
ncbi:hypothetical protein M885DRAFT_470781 [Pelagophyceae sp. CCMP2097]|nr:hypothetical protein M885DRAFT_470781 [Pelagophyceae sp. CCMP2097]